jgi:hypothetical protein
MDDRRRDELRDPNPGGAGMTRRPIIALAVSAFAAAALAAGVAYATIPDGQGVIHACYKANKGDLRVVDDGACASGEVPLVWNQTGPQGPPGAQGPEGPAGASGLTTLTKVGLGNAVSDSFMPPDTSFHERLTIGRFTKLFDTSRVRITWQGTISISGPSSGTCTFQLRVDGAKDTGSTSDAVESGEGGDATMILSGGSTYSEVPVSDSVTFPALAAGMRFITVWVRGTEPADHCTVNGAGFPMTVEVEEIP